jgi:hypothetical protein
MVPCRKDYKEVWRALQRRLEIDKRKTCRVGYKEVSRVILQSEMRRKL